MLQVKPEKNERQELAESMANEYVTIRKFLFEDRRLPLEASAAYAEHHDFKEWRVHIYPEDRSAITKAGYKIEADAAKQEPIPVVLDKSGRRILRIVLRDGSGRDIRGRGEAASETPTLHVISSAAPVLTADDEPRAPLAYAEPDEYTPRRRGDDGDNTAFTPNKARLYAKIATVMGKVNPVGERGLSGQGYTYATDGDMFNAVRSEMAAANLAMLPPRLLRRYKDETSNDYFIDILFTLADGDTGEIDTTPWIAKLGNNTDKAIHAAMTMCVKYFLKYTFLVATDKDTDADGETDGAKSSGVSKRKTPKQAAEDVQTGTAVIHFIEVRTSDDKPDKPYIVGEGGYVTFTRQPFREGSIPCEEWDKPGKYDLIAPVKITYRVKGTGPKEITGAAWVSEVEGAAP